MHVKTGLDRLAAGEGPDLGGGVALLCHPASVDRNLEHAIDVVGRRGPLRSLLGPEHGLDAAAQDMEEVGEGASAVSGPPVHSLYGATFESLRPTPDMFHGAEWLVVDLQDVGARYYTYVWTALLAAEVALDAGLRVLLLDRPNPLGGTDASVEGGTIESGFESFVGLHPVAVRHGLTLVEIVDLALQERGCKRLERLTFLECLGWTREMRYDATGLPWVLPSPNMPTLETALVYPGQCLLEGTNLSEGRGTTRPFELWGAPWLDGRRLAADVDPEDVPGLALRPVTFKPMFQKHGGDRCGGVQLHVRDGAAVRSLRSTWALLAAARAQDPERFAWRREAYEFVDDIPAIDLLAGGPWLREGLEASVSPAQLEASQEDARQAYLSRRRPFLRYR